MNRNNDGSGVMFGTAAGFSIFFRNVDLRRRVPYTCKIIDQQQGLFNFDKFIFNFE